jgi:hypothetical protein
MDSQDTSIIDKGVSLPISTDRIKIRPNNYAIMIPITQNDPTVHLPIVKNEGKSGKTIREYIYSTDFTIERTTKNIIIYQKKSLTQVVNKPEDVGRAEDRVKDKLLSKAMQFQEQFPTIKLDIFNAKWKTKEVEVKSKQLEWIPRNLRMRNDIFKKEYRKGIELKQQGADPLYVKQFVRNLTLKDWSPELAEKVDLLVAYTKQIELHLEVENETLKTLKAIQDSLKPKESIFMKIKKWFK